MSYSTTQEIKKENIEKLSEIFNQNILSNSNRIETLKTLSKKGELVKELRPIAWKLFLNNLPNLLDLNEWIETINSQRIRYKKKIKKYFSIKKPPSNGRFFSLQNFKMKFFKT